MARHLKTARSSEQRAEDDANVRQTVHQILDDVGRRGDAAIAELSDRFDNYSPESFRLDHNAIDAAMGKVGKQDMAISGLHRSRCATLPSIKRQACTM